MSGWRHDERGPLYHDSGVDTWLRVDRVELAVRSVIQVTMKASGDELAVAVRMSPESALMLAGLITGVALEARLDTTPGQTA